MSRRVGGKPFEDENRSAVPANTSQEWSHHSHPPSLTPSPTSLTLPLSSPQMQVVRAAAGVGKKIIIENEKNANSDFSEEKEKEEKEEAQRGDGCVGMSKALKIANKIADKKNKINKLEHELVKKTEQYRTAAEAAIEKDDQTVETEVSLENSRNDIAKTRGTLGALEFQIKRLNKKYGQITNQYKQLDTASIENYQRRATEANDYRDFTERVLNKIPADLRPQVLWNMMDECTPSQREILIQRIEGGFINDIPTMREEKKKLKTQDAQDELMMQLRERREKEIQNT